MKQMKRIMYMLYVCKYMRCDLSEFINQASEHICTENKII